MTRYPTDPGQDSFFPTKILFFHPPTPSLVTHSSASGIPTGVHILVQVTKSDRVYTEGLENVLLSNLSILLCVSY